MHNLPAFSPFILNSQNSEALNQDKDFNLEILEQIVQKVNDTDSK